jgi:two-component system response regulator QseB
MVVEDDDDLRLAVTTELAAAGLTVDRAGDLAGADAQLAGATYHCVVFDRMLPDGDAIDYVQRRRQQGWAVPVLFLTARDTTADIVAGFEHGGDDYLVKPFALAELLSRVRALARRSFGLVNDTIEIRQLALHEATMRVTVDERAVELSRSEFELLCLLMKRADRVLTRRVLEEQVLPGGLDNESNVLDVHMSNLRRKIGPGYIRTVRGVGYVIDRAAPAKGGA